MSEALVSDTGCLLWDSIRSDERSPIAQGLDELCAETAERRSTSLRPVGKTGDRQSSSAAVEPGQLWVIELSATESGLSSIEHRAVSTANVVIYDRPLAPIVAEILPLGGYAESAPPSDDGGSDQALERCLQFVRDGWSVVRLVEHSHASHKRTERVQRLSVRLKGTKAQADPTVLLLADAGTRACHKTEASLGALGTVLTAHSVENRLSIVFGGIHAEAAPRVSVAASNGLAG
jgi:hypothetical protein